MMETAVRALERRLFPPEKSTWLGILRIGMGCQVVLYSLSLRSDWIEFFSLQSAGPIKRDLTEAILSADSHFIPRIGWLVTFGNRLGLGEDLVIWLAWWLLILAGISLLVGFLSRPSAIVAAFLHLCAVKSTGALTYGFDNFTTIGLFYVAIAPLPDRWAIDTQIWKRPEKNPELLGFFRRVLQLHLCLIYFFGGITKCAGPGWWDGANIWRAMIRPPFNVIPPETLVLYRNLFPAIAIGVCLLEVSYPFLIWPERTRPFCLAAIIAMHIGIGLALGLHLFAFVMIVLNLAAFGPGTQLFGSRRAVPLVSDDLPKTK